MTRALHEFVASHRNHETIEDPKELEALDQEFLATVQDFHTHIPEAEEVEDVAEARRQIERGLGKLSLHDMIGLMDAAAVSGDARLHEVAVDTINTRFPIEGTGHAAYEKANARSRDEWMEALRLARDKNGELPFGDALMQAGITTDEKYDSAFDTVIDESNLLVRKQRGTITDREQQDLDKYQESHRRNEEQRRLQNMGVEDDEKFDDAVAYDPFADEDDEDDLPKKAA